MRILTIILLFISVVVSAQTGGERNRVFHPLQLDPDVWYAPDESRYTLNTDIDTLYDLTSNGYDAPAYGAAYNVQMQRDPWGNLAFWNDSAEQDIANSYELITYDSLTGDYTFVMLYNDFDIYTFTGTWSRQNILFCGGAADAGSIQIFTSNYNPSSSDECRFYMVERTGISNGSVALACDTDSGSDGQTFAIKTTGWTNVTEVKIYRHWRNSTRNSCSYLKAAVVTVKDADTALYPRFMGWGNSGAEGFYGYFYDFQIYHRILTKEEIDQIFRYYEDRYMRGTGFNPARYVDEDSIKVYLDFNNSNCVDDVTGTTINSFNDLSSNGYSFSKSGTDAADWQQSHLYRGKDLYYENNDDAFYYANETNINEIWDGDTVTSFYVGSIFSVGVNETGYSYGTWGTGDGDSDGIAWAFQSTAGAVVNYFARSSTVDNVWYSGNVSSYIHYSDQANNTTTDSTLLIVCNVMRDYPVQDYDNARGRWKIGSSASFSNGENVMLAALVVDGELSQDQREQIFHELAFQYGNSDYNPQITPWTPWDYRDNIIGWYDFTETNTHEYSTGTNVTRVRDISGTSGDAYNDTEANISEPQWETSVGNVSIQSINPPTVPQEGFIINGDKVRKAGSAFSIIGVTDQSNHGGFNMAQTFTVWQGDDTGEAANRQYRPLVYNPDSLAIVGVTTPGNVNVSTAGAGDKMGLPSGSTTKKKAWVFTFDDTNEPRFWWDGVEYLWGATAASSSYTDAFGHDDYIGIGVNKDNEGSDAGGYLSLIFLDKALTDEEVTQWTNWLINYYGIEK